MTHELTARLERIEASLASLSRELVSVITELNKPKPIVTIKRRVVAPPVQVTSPEPEFIVSSKPHKRAKDLVKAREKIAALTTSGEDPGKLDFYIRFAAHLEETLK